ncbi:MAG: RimK family alpha-L-glutamate ligase [Clostridia bacterium]|nr:RimK family alpha-L-glutamate ligase [Clostridia bacterium]
MKGIVLMNAYPAGEKFYRQSERIASALTDLGVCAKVKKNGELAAAIKENGEIELSERADFVVYLDKDKYLGRALEKNGVRVFNRMEAIEACDDKALTLLTLSGYGINVVETIPAPLCYTMGVSPSEAFLKQVEGLGYPLVAKKSYGSFGAGVVLVRSREELFALEKEWLQLPHLYEKFIAESAGKDIRVIVVGGKALAAIRRVARVGEFRSNIELGGSGEKVELSQTYASAAEACAKALGLDYCGVDLLETEAGPLVCEVNSNAFFEGLEAATGVDVAAAYAKHIVESMKKAGR